MGLCELTKGQKWSKRMIISTHGLEERPTCQVWMAAGPGWHKAVGDSRCPGAQQSSSYPCLWLHGQCWAPDSACLEHFQLQHSSSFWFLMHTRIQVWYLMLVHEAPLEILQCSTIGNAGGFPTVEHLGFCHAVALFGGVLLPGRAASKHSITHQRPSWSWHSA